MNALSESAAVEPALHRPRIILADDHRLLLDALEQVLRAEYDVVASVCNGRELVEAARRLSPDLIALDMSMPELNGIEAARQIRKFSNEIKILFVSMHAEQAYVRAAIDAGASGFVTKSSATRELLQAVSEVLAGRTYYSREFHFPAAGPVLRFTGTKFGGELTSRQREVLQLIAEGKSNKEVAATLNISVKTAEFHKSALMDKLDLRSTAELTRYALKHGIVTEERL